MRLRPPGVIEASKPMTKLDLGGTAIWYDQSSRIQWPPEAPLWKAEPYSAGPGPGAARTRGLVERVDVRPHALLHEDRVGKRLQHSRNLIVPNCGSAQIEFCHNF